MTSQTRHLSFSNAKDSEFAVQFANGMHDENLIAVQPGKGMHDENLKVKAAEQKSKSASAKKAFVGKVLDRQETATSDDNHNQKTKL